MKMCYQNGKIRNLVTFYLFLSKKNIGQSRKNDTKIAKKMILVSKNGQNSV